MVLPSAAPSQGVGEGTPRAEAAQHRALRVTFLIAVTKCSTKVRTHDRFILVQFKSAESMGWQQYGVAGHSATTVRKLRERGADVQLPRWCRPHLG